MRTEDVSEAYVSALNRLMAGMLGGTGGPGRTFLPNGRWIKNRPGRNVYRYFEDRKSNKMFCWTILPDNRGDFWTFNYVPVGKGSRTPGKARRWKIDRLVRASHRNTARKRAMRRLDAEWKKRAAPEAA